MRQMSIRRRSDLNDVESTSKFQPLITGQYLVSQARPRGALNSLTSCWYEWICCRHVGRYVTFRPPLLNKSVQCTRTHLNSYLTFKTQDRGETKGSRGDARGARPNAEFSYSKSISCRFDVACLKLVWFWDSSKIDFDIKRRYHFDIDGGIGLWGPTAQGKVVLEPAIFRSRINMLNRGNDIESTSVRPNISHRTLRADFPLFAHLRICLNLAPKSSSAPGGVTTYVNKQVSITQWSHEQRWFDDTALRETNEFKVTPKLPSSSRASHTVATFSTRK